MKFIFIGGTYRGYKLLNSLVTQKYLPSQIFILKEDQHELLQYSSKIKEIADKFAIKSSLRKKLNKEDEELIISNKWDFAIVCGWRTIINPSINDSFKVGILAAHDSLLPAYRGFAPLNWAIINGEKKTGVTLFLINDGEVDSGEIVGQESVNIDFEDYAIDVFEKICDATNKVVLDFISNYLANNVKLIKQDENQATYTCKRTPDDGRINFNDSSEQVYNFIRALAHPYPGAFLQHENRTYHVRRAFIGPKNNHSFIGRIPGRVIQIDKDGVEVLCSKGTIKISEWEDKSTGTIENPSITIKSIKTTFLS